MSFQVGDVVTFNKANATVMGVDSDTYVIATPSGHIGNVPRHLLGKIDLPPQSADEAVVAALGKIENHLASIDVTLKKLLEK